MVLFSLWRELLFRINLGGNSLSKKVGVHTGTIIYRDSLSRSSGKYGLKTEEKKRVKRINSIKRDMKKQKVKCLRCKYLKDASFCLRREIEIKKEDFEELTECRFASKI